MVTQTARQVRRRTGAGAVLRVRDFRWLWTAQTVSTVGDQVFPVAAAVAVLDAGGGAAQVGFVMGARWLAVALFALVGGVWADRLPRRLVMMAADVFRFAVVGVLALLPLGAPVWALAALVFAVGAGEAFFRPAETALLPSLLDRDLLPAANGLTSISYRSAAVVGPGIGGVLVTVLGGPRAAFAVDAATFALSLACLLRVREPAAHGRAAPGAPAAADRGTGPQGSRSFLSELREGVAEVRAHPWVAANLVAASLLLLLVVAPENVLLPVVGRREFGTDSVYAVSLALFSAGGVLGALLAIRWRPRHRGRVAWLMGLAFVAVPLAMVSPSSPWPLWVANLVGGLAWEPFTVWWQSALQEEIPPDRLARVASMDWMASFSLMPLGMALVGPLAEVVGESAVLVGSAAALVVITAAVLRVPGVADFRTSRA